MPAGVPILRFTQLCGTEPLSLDEALAAYGLENPPFNAERIDGASSQSVRELANDQKWGECFVLQGKRDPFLVVSPTSLSNPPGILIPALHVSDCPD